MKHYDFLFVLVLALEAKPEAECMLSMFSTNTSNPEGKIFFSFICQHLFTWVGECHTWKSEVRRQPWESVLSLYHVGSGMNSSPQY